MHLCNHGASVTGEAGVTGKAGVAGGAGVTDQMWGSLSMSYNILDRVLHVLIHPPCWFRWKATQQGLSIEEAYSCFTYVLQDTFQKFLPLKQPVSSERLPWTRLIPKSVKQNKRQAWLKYKDAHSKFGRSSPITLRLWQAFRSLSTEFRSAVCQDVIKHENSLITSDNSNRKRFHSYLRSK